MYENLSENCLDDVVTVLKSRLAAAESEIEGLRQQLTGLKHAYAKDCEEVRRRLQEWRCEGCRRRMAESNNGSGDDKIVSRSQSCDLPLRYIGTVFTHFPEKRGTPRQPAICADLGAKLVLNTGVFTNPEHSLEGLEEYSHMWILFHFDKNDSNHVRAKVAPPRLNGTRKGVFATRSPHRPCPIGLSLVRINHIVENVIYFSGVDMVDQTPILDIKPYIPQYDSPADETIINLELPPPPPSFDNVIVESPSLQELESLTIDARHRHIMDGEEDDHGDSSTAFVASVPTTTRPSISSIDGIEETFQEPRSVSRIGEREAPDGEEEETNATPLLTAAVPQSSATGTSATVTVPSWIDNPPVPTLSVYFTQKAQAQLHQLGIEGERKKNVIRHVLQEDPRSIYLREKVENTNYVFRIAELYVSCKFDDVSHTVRVFQVFQDAVNRNED